MKYKVTFARIVNVAELVEGVIEAVDLDDANHRFEAGDFDRFLVVKREQRQVTPVGAPEFDEIG